MSVKVRLGRVWQAWQIWSGLVLARSGEAGVVRKCAVCCVPAWQEWFGIVCLVSVGFGSVWHGAAGVVPLGEVTRGKVWYCMARSGRRGWDGSVCQRMVWQERFVWFRWCVIRNGLEWQAWQRPAWYRRGSVLHGQAGMVWHGLLRYGSVRFGRLGGVGSGMIWLGEVGFGRMGRLWNGGVRHVAAWTGRFGRKEE